MDYGVYACLALEMWCEWGQAVVLVRDLVEVGVVVVPCRLCYGYVGKRVIGGVVHCHLAAQRPIPARKRCVKASREEVKGETSNELS